jgi:G3E family GTPase
MAPIAAKPSRGRRVAPLPLCLVIGLSPAATQWFLARFSQGQPAARRIAWIEQDDGAGGTPIDQPNADMKHSDDRGPSLKIPAGCICCVGQALFQASLPRVLRQRQWDHLVLAVAPSNHPAQVLDLLRSAAWSQTVQVTQVLLVIDAAQQALYRDAVRDVPAIAPAIALLARAQLQAADCLILTHHAKYEDQAVDLPPFRESIASHLYGAVDMIELRARDHLADLTRPTASVATAATSLAGLELTSSPQATLHWQLDVRASETITLSAIWPAQFRFDRRRLADTLNMLSERIQPLSGDGVFATARDWYRWSIQERRSSLRSSGFRRHSSLCICVRYDDATKLLLDQLQHQLRQAVIADTGCNATGV